MPPEHSEPIVTTMRTACSMCVYEPSTPVDICRRNVDPKTLHAPTSRVAAMTPLLFPANG